MRTFPIVWTLLISTTVGTPLIALQDAPFTLRVDVPFVTVDVSVLDATGQPLPPLAPEDFTIIEDGQTQKIVSFSPVAAPYSILLLFDRSASTRSERDFMQRAILAFLDGLRLQDRVAVAGFDGDFNMLADWGSSAQRVSSAVTGLSAGDTAGETNFYESLRRAVGRDFRGVSGRRAVIVFSDGRDSGHYKQTVKEQQVPPAATDNAFLRIVRELREARIPLYFVAVNTDRNLGASPGGDYLNLERVFPSKGLGAAFLRETRERLERIADATGGRVFFPESMAGVAPVYARIRSDLTASYTLGYVSSNGAGDGRVRSITVQVGRPGVTVRQSRDSYAAP